MKRLGKVKAHHPSHQVGAGLVQCGVSRELSCVRPEQEGSIGTKPLADGASCCWARVSLASLTSDRSEG